MDGHRAHIITSSCGSQQYHPGGQCASLWWWLLGFSRQPEALLAPWGTGDRHQAPRPAQRVMVPRPARFVDVPPDVTEMKTLTHSYTHSLHACHVLTTQGFWVNEILSLEPGTQLNFMCEHEALRHRLNAPRFLKCNHRANRGKTNFALTSAKHCPLGQKTTERTGRFSGHPSHRFKSPIHCAVPNHRDYTDMPKPLHAEIGAISL